MAGHIYASLNLLSPGNKRRERMVYGNQNGSATQLPSQDLSARPEACSTASLLLLHIFISTPSSCYRDKPLERERRHDSPKTLGNATSFFFTFLLVWYICMDGIAWRKRDRSRSSGRKASKQVSSKSLVASLRRAAARPKGHGQKRWGGDTQAAELGPACRVEATGGQHNSEIQHVGKGRAVQCFKNEYKVTPAERSQERVARAEVTSKEDKLRRSTSPQAGRCSAWAARQLALGLGWPWDEPAALEHRSAGCRRSDSHPTGCLFSNSVPWKLPCSYNTCPYTL